MYTRDYRDIIGGLLMVVFGLWLCWYAQSQYELGTLRRMGPGMFPAGIGLLIAVFGGLVVAPALFRQGTRIEVDWFTGLCVSLGVAGFALLIKPMGLIPAILAVVLLSSMAERSFRPKGLAMLCVTLCLLAWLVFRLGLGLPMAMFNWPF